LSKILELITAAPFEHPDLLERRVSWGDDTFPRDPPEFEFDNVRWLRASTKPTLLRLLPREFGTGSSSLYLDFEVVADWAAGTLPPKVEAATRRLFAGLQSPWALVYEANARSGSEVLHSGTDTLFDVIDHRIRSPVAHDITIVLPPGMSPR
jgi:hypothetical protein